MKTIFSLTVYTKQNYFAIKKHHQWMIVVGTFLCALFRSTYDAKSTVLFPLKYWIKHLFIPKQSQYNPFWLILLRIFFRERFGHVDHVFLTQISLSSFLVQANDHIWLCTLKSTSGESLKRLQPGWKTR